MSDIAKGDVVTLKSGGPKMSVEDTGDYLMSAGTENGAKCSWFDGGKPMEKVFDIAVLTKVTDDDYSITSI
jgi:uncharacterized protein YodC (DUF2158 family)